MLANWSNIIMEVLKNLQQSFHKISFSKAGEKVSSYDFHPVCTGMLRSKRVSDSNSSDNPHEGSYKHSIP